MRLIGRLPTYYLKQVAQAVVTEVEGVRRVVNLIEVVARTDDSAVRRATRSAGDEFNGFRH
jgi:hypothetical protein